MVRIKREGSIQPDIDYGSLNKFQGTIIIPKNIYNPQVKVEIDLEEEGTVDLNDYNGEPYVINIPRLTRKTINRGLGYAEILLDNPEGFWNNKIIGGEEIRIYLDYSNATDQVWQGRVDVPYKNLTANTGYFIKLVCRERPEIQDKKICTLLSNLSGSNSITKIVDDWFPSLLTYANLASMPTIFNRSHVWKSGIKVLREIFNKSGFLGYIDFDNDINSFTERINEDEKISVGVNCAVVDDFGSDLQKRSNNVILIGDRVESSQNIFFTWSKKDSSNISTFWQKDLVENDSTISSQDVVENDNELLYNDENRDFIEGSLLAIGGLSTLKPGESIFCSIPYCGINDYFQIHEFTHSISPSKGWITRVFYSKKLKPEQMLFDKRDEKIDGNRLASKNPYGMTNAFVITFEEDISQIDTNTNTQELNSSLQLTSGNTTGNAESRTKLMDDNISKVELRVYGEDLGSSYYQISVDNKITWEDINLDSEHEVTSTTLERKTLAVKWFLVEDSDNPNPKIYTSWCGVNF